MRGGMMSSDSTWRRGCMRRNGAMTSHACVYVSSGADSSSSAFSRMSVARSHPWYSASSARGYLNTNPMHFAASRRVCTRGRVVRENRLSSRSGGVSSRPASRSLQHTSSPRSSSALSTSFEWGASMRCMMVPATSMRYTASCRAARFSGASLLRQMRARHDAAPSNTIGQWWSSSVFSRLRTESTTSGDFATAGECRRLLRARRAARSTRTLSVANAATSSLGTRHSTSAWTMSLGPDAREPRMV
mmetsp:Transcript_38126/g.95936  ORF Transcript_38126/g.95936 Transcript_38126/m.95936 type:complete len:246 (+) Transcript_38126:1111-1848(+)